MPTPRKLILLLLPLGLILSTGCQGGKTQSKTPQDAFANLKKAADKEDIKLMLAVMTPKSVDSMVCQMIGVCAMAKMQADVSSEMKNEAKQGDPIEAAKKVLALAKKYGLKEESLDGISIMAGPEDPPMKTALESINNKSGFAAATMKIMQEEMGPGQSIFKGLKEATLGDVTIDGDSASAPVTINGGSQTFKFEKIDGTWLIEPPGV